MGRRSTPGRIHEARRAAIRNRLVSEGLATETAEAWCDRWEAEGDRRGLERHRLDYWQLGWAWISEQRLRRRASQGLHG